MWLGGHRISEELEVSNEAVDLERLNNGAPLLDSHSDWRLDHVLGVVERAWIADGKGLAVIRFGKTERSNEAFEQVRDGILRSISVGYSVEEYEVRIEDDGDREIYRATKWTPAELSLVPIPADDGAKTRSEREREFPCVIRRASPTMEANMPTGTGADDKAQTDGKTVEQKTDENTRSIKIENLVVHEAESGDGDTKTVDVDAERKTAQAAERKRISEINEHAREYEVGDEVRNKAINDGVDAEKFRIEALEAWCANKRAEVSHVWNSRGEVVRDEAQTRHEGMIGALTSYYFGTALEGPAENFRGLTPKLLAINLAGGHRWGASEFDLVQQGMTARSEMLSRAGAHSTSDFTFLTAETLNRQLRAQYNARPGTWRPLSRQRTATDFRTLHSVQMGADTELKKVNEQGEYEGTVLSDTGESFAVVRYGRFVTLTFEAVINDDLSAFGRLPTDFARGATNRESTVVWNLIKANGNMSDGNALFSSAHGNIGTGGAISVTTVGEARKLMWEQTFEGSTDEGDDFISATPDWLYVPPALEVAALQFVTATTPETDGNTNPFKSTLQTAVEARLGAAAQNGDDAAWYMFDTSLPTFEHAFLQGFEAPQITPQEKMNPRGVSLQAEHIFGAGVVEFRGAFKNAGS